MLVLLSVWGSVLARPGCNPQTDLWAWTQESVLWKSSPWSEQVHVSAEICQRSRGHHNHGRARRRNRTAVCSFGWVWCGADEEQAPSSDIPYTSPVFNNQNGNVHFCTHLCTHQSSKHLRYCLSLYSIIHYTTIMLILLLLMQLHTITIRHFNVHIVLPLISSSRFLSHSATHYDYIYIHIKTPLLFANISIESC